MATLVLSTILLIAADGKQVERCRCATRCREAKPGFEKDWTLTRIMTFMALKARTVNDFRLSDLGEQ